MCRFALDVCPYPDQDPISALIFNPTKAGAWESCDKPKAWGRLSCGNLSIAHPVNVTPSTICLSPPRGLAARDNNGIDKHLIPSKHGKHTSIEITEIKPNDEEVIFHDVACVLCTTVLKLVSTKSKELQANARHFLLELEATMRQNPELRKVQEAIKEKAIELEGMKQEAWKMAYTLLPKEDSTLEEKR